MAYSNKDRSPEALEEEISNLEKQENNSRQDDDSNLSPEEKTWKKRHGDLRRHQQQEASRLNSRIEQLEQQLESVSKKAVQYPKTQAEVENWMRRYPDLANVIKTIAMTEANSAREEVNRVRVEISESRLQIAREKAKAELDRLHPDFDQIDATEDFHNWLSEKSLILQNAIYENDTDAQAAAEVVDLYKAEKRKGKDREDKPFDARNAARSVSVNGRSNTPSETGEYRFKESQIQAMNPREYEKYEAEIDEAMRNGRVLMDMTG